MQMTPSTFDPPAGACDCHVHVFGDPQRYPYAPQRRYTPGLASVAELDALHASIGISRTVIVQPSPYGTDNACTLDAVDSMGGRARAVVVVAPGIDDDELDAMSRRGVRGVRVNLETDGIRDAAAAGKALTDMAARVAAWRWHVQVYAGIDVIASLADRLRHLPVPLVVDHFGQADAARGPDCTAFRRLVDLVGNGVAYVKLSAPHRISREPDCADVGPLVTSLVAANEDRLLWGTDWPHPGGARCDPTLIEPFNTIDDAYALSRFAQWVGDDRVLETILVQNPASLYDFPS